MTERVGKKWMGSEGSHGCGRAECSDEQTNLSPK